MIAIVLSKPQEYVMEWCIGAYDTWDDNEAQEVLGLDEMPKLPEIINNTAILDDTPKELIEDMIDRLSNQFQDMCADVNTPESRGKAMAARTLTSKLKKVSKNGIR